MRPYWDSFRAALRYVEGTSIAIEFRSAEDQVDRLPALVAELLALNVKVIVTSGTTAVRVAKDAAKATPIVIAIGADPVEQGFAKSLARPGRNITGLSILGGEIAQKRALTAGSAPDVASRNEPPRAAATRSPDPRAAATTARS